MRILLMLMLTSVPAFAQFESVYLQKLKAATSASEVAKLREQYESLRENRTVCRAQIEAKLLPVACYRLLHSELAWQIKPSVSKEFLDDQCRQAASTALQKDPENLEIETAAVSTTCSEFVDKARDLQKYRHPENISTLFGADLESSFPL